MCGLLAASASLSILIAYGAEPRMINWARGAAAGGGVASRLPPSRACLRASVRSASSSSTEYHPFDCRYRPKRMIGERASQ